MRTNTTNEKSLSLAILGCGIAGRSHLLDAVTQPGINVVAVCAAHRESAERVANEFGVPEAYDDVPALLHSCRPGAVVVATPPQVMVTQATWCLEAGADVLVEKPLTPSMLQLARLRHAMRAARRGFVVP